MKFPRPLTAALLVALVASSTSAMEQTPFAESLRRVLSEPSEGGVEGDLDRAGRRRQRAIARAVRKIDKHAAAGKTGLAHDLSLLRHVVRKVGCASPEGPYRADALGLFVFPLAVSVDARIAELRTGVEQISEARPRAGAKARADLDDAEAAVDQAVAALAPPAEAGKRVSSSTGPKAALRHLSRALRETRRASRLVDVETDCSSLWPVPDPVSEAVVRYAAPGFDGDWESMTSFALTHASAERTEGPQGPGYEFRLGVCSEGSPALFYVIRLPAGIVDGGLVGVHSATLPHVDGMRLELHGGPGDDMLIDVASGTVTIDSFDRELGTISGSAVFEFDARGWSVIRLDYDLTTGDERPSE